MPVRLPRAWPAVGLVVVLTACNGGDARALWKPLIAKCANNDLLGPNVLFFGPSNNLGPGSIFQNLSAGGTQVSHLTAEYFGGAGGTVLVAGADFRCGADSARSTSLGANLSLNSALGVSGELGAQLKRASTLTVQVDALRWEQLVTGPYRTLVAGLPEGSQVRKDLRAGHLVLARALRVSGLVSTLEFSTSVGGDVKAKYPNIAVGNAPGPLGIGLSGAWDGSTRLVIKSSADFYIAGELRHVDEFGLAAEGAEIGALVTGVDKVKVGPS